jgi:nitroreductase
MKGSFVKRIVFAALLLFIAFTWAHAQESKVIKLDEPIKKGGLSIMESLSKRASSRAWADKDLSSQDLSNLLWAANGINRSDSNKRTAPSALNSQDVDVYVFMKGGVYLYDAANHALNLRVSGDHRSEILKSRASAGGEKRILAPVTLLLVSDVSRFSMGTDEKRREYGAIDTGLVSENIGLFCAGNGLATVPRASIDRDAAKALLELSDTQYIFLENSVGYPPEAGGNL